MNRFGLYNSQLKKWEDDEFNLVLRLLFGEGGVWTDTDLNLSAGTGMNVLIDEGFALVKTDSELWDLIIKWFHSDGDQVTIANGGATHPRYDLVCAKLDLVNNTASIVSSGGANADALMKGVEQATPNVPAVPLNYCQLGYVLVPAGATSIGQCTIFNTRPVAGARAGSNSFEWNQFPTGAINGVNTLFTTPQPYLGGTLQVFRDGQKLDPGVGNDYVETNPALGTFTLASAPSTGTSITVHYSKNVSTSGNADTVDGYSANLVPTANTIPVLDSQARLPYFDTWVPLSGVLTRQSSDDPTYVMRIASQDLTSVLQLGHRITWVQNGIRRFGIITAIALNSGNTDVTILTRCDNVSVNFDLLNHVSNPITGAFWSASKSPYGFDTDPIKWTIKVTDNVQRTQSSPVNNQFYNLGSVQISVPIGAWSLGYSVYMIATGPTTTNTGLYPSIQCALSTSNSALSDGEFLAENAGNNTAQTGQTTQIRKNVLLTSKTTFFFISRTTTSSSTTGIFNQNQSVPLVIEARCAYL